MHELDTKIDVKTNPPGFSWKRLVGSSDIRFNLQLLGRGGGYRVFEKFDSPAKSYSVQHFTTHKTKWNIKVSIFCQHFLVHKNEMF